MKLVVYLLLISLFIVEYAAEFAGSAGRILTWMPELLSLITLLVVVLRVVATKQLLVHPKYLVFFFLFSLHILAGVILNAVQPGAIMQGLRVYLKFFPFFLLPAVYLFSDQEMKNQLRLVLVLAVMQFPLVLYQRFVQYYGLPTGDNVTGTLAISSILSILLVSTIAVLIAFFLKRKINLLFFTALLLLLFVPTTLNETKGTFFLLPFAIIIPALAHAVAEKKIATLIPVAVIGVVLVGGFATAYNMHIGTNKENPRALGEFIMQGKVLEYLYKGSEGNKAFMENSVADEIGRVDTLVLAWRTLSKDFSKLLLGLGIGNVGPSFSKYLQGEYSEKYAHLGPNITSFGFMLWEIGLIGLLFSLVGCYLVFADARRLSLAGGFVGAFACGWLAVVVIYTVALGYKNILGFNVIGYLFWYFCGYVAVSRLRWEASQTDHAIAVDGDAVSKLGLPARSH